MKEYNEDMNTNQCWVYLESGECVDAATVAEAIAILTPRYRGTVLTSENVVSDTLELFAPEEPNGDFYSDRYGDW